MTFYSKFSSNQIIDLTNKYEQYLDNSIFVHCNRIEGVHLFYKCPFCFKMRGKTKYSPLKKNGQPYKSIKPTYHHHGSNFDNSNRVEHRGSHCSAKNNIDEICGSHKDLQLKLARNKITKGQYDYIMKKRHLIEKELSKSVLIVIDDNTQKVTSEEQQSLNFIRHQNTF